MRHVLAAAGLGLVLTVAGAASPDQPTPEARAYFAFSFGGEHAAPRDFHYGLRLDHDARFTDGRVPPLMQLDFTRRGFSAARINGMNVVRQEYRLRQAEEPAEEAAVEEMPAEEPAEEPVEEVPEEPSADSAQAPAEGAEGAAAQEPGFFAKVGGFFGGLFGGGDEAVEEAALEEMPAGGEVADGRFLGFNAVDWGLLVVGVVGLGAATSEVADGEESPGPGGGGDGGADGGADGGGDGGGDICPIPDTCIPYAPKGRYADDRVAPEYQEWLDGGTGHMGDLGG
jgi:hypothetical protein